MRRLFPIISVLIISCGQSKEQKQVITDTTNVKVDTVIATTSEKDSTSPAALSPLTLQVNGYLETNEGNKWHVLNDLEAKWMSGQFDYFIAPKRKENPDYPYIAKGDFNGDGKADIAAVVTDPSKTKFQLAILLDAAADTRKFISWEEDIMEDAAISVIPRSTVQGFEGEKTKKVTMKGDGINVEYFEKAAFVLYLERISVSNGYRQVTDIKKVSLGETFRLI